MPMEWSKVTLQPLSILTSTSNVSSTELTTRFYRSNSLRLWSVKSNWKMLVSTWRCCHFMNETCKNKSRDLIGSIQQRSYTAHYSPQRPTLPVVGGGGGPPRRHVHDSIRPIQLTVALGLKNECPPVLETTRVNFASLPKPTSGRFHCTVLVGPFTRNVQGQRGGWDLSPSSWEAIRCFTDKRFS